MITPNRDIPKFADIMRSAVIQASVPPRDKRTLTVTSRIKIGNRRRPILMHRRMKDQEQHAQDMIHRRPGGRPLDGTQQRHTTTTHDQLAFGFTTKVAKMMGRRSRGRRRKIAATIVAVGGSALVVAGLYSSGGEGRSRIALSLFAGSEPPPLDFCLGTAEDCKEAEKEEHAPEVVELDEDAARNQVFDCTLAMTPADCTDGEREKRCIWQDNVVRDASSGEVKMMGGCQHKQCICTGHAPLDPAWDKYLNIVADDQTTPDQLYHGCDSYSDKWCDLMWSLDPVTSMFSSNTWKGVWCHARWCFVEPDCPASRLLSITADQPNESMDEPGNVLTAPITYVGCPQDLAGIKNFGWDNVNFDGLNVTASEDAVHKDMRIILDHAASVDDGSAVSTIATLAQPTGEPEKGDQGQQPPY
ncbi:unnamed protein product [Amoebophrya sp. A25]|nr:unnamed protein product [Amoebophrya sp. A25]|eukprot:GSA25T00012064001.1